MDAVSDDIDEYNRTYGLEAEYLLVDDRLDLAEETIRDRIVEKTDFLKKELGCSQVEINTSPVRIVDGYEDMMKEYSGKEYDLKRVAEEEKHHIVRLGMYPGKVDSIKITSNKHRYIDRLNIIERIRPKYVDIRINGKDYIHMQNYIAGAQALHINIHVSKGEAVYRLNRAYELSGYIMALVAASPFLDGCDSIYDDIRQVLWNNGYEDRKLDEYIIRDNRTTIPATYYVDIEDYIRKVSEQIQLDDNYDTVLYSCQKMNWRICRLKVIDFESAPKIILELRYLPIQLTLERDVLCSLFIIGCIFYNEDKCQDLLPISLVSENMRRACHFSMDEKMYFYNGRDIVEKPVKEILEILLHRSLCYWNKINIEIAERVDEKISEYIERGNVAQEIRKVRYQEHYNDENWIEAIIRKGIV
ncbi:glutamate-cysteine ligase family protein [Butyrivibrio sp. AE3003]|uniref:glutamate-cysteine ligase family protein n=1 Tax=Butyrivibrio sp. AE3003 TaxID=1496721 RepID=UPI000ACBB02D|nr:glutamate-cysteine ligase family protein [Butyrivibrio sp. AE3003]